MLNRCVLMGRLVRDPSLREANGQSVTSFTIAVDRDFGDRVTDFVDCVAWRKTAEFVSNYFHKGQLAVVSGSLQSRKWEGRDGKKNTSWEIVCDNVYFGGDKTAAEAIEDDDNGDLPF